MEKRWFACTQPATRRWSLPPILYVRMTQLRSMSYRFLRVGTQIIQFRTEFINSFESELRNRPSNKTVNFAVFTY
jgi:hypothetical protein